MSDDVYVSFGADTASLEASLSVAKAQVAAVAAQMRTLAREMQKTGASADSELGQKLRAAAQDLVKAKEEAGQLSSALRKTGEGAGGIGRISNVFSGLLGPIREVQEGLAKVAELFLAAFAVERIQESIEKLVDLNEETKRAALVLGMSTDEVAGLRAASEAAGASFDTITTAFSRLGVNLTNQSKAASRALDLLGLSFGRLQSLSSGEKFEAIGQALMKVADPASRDAAATALFGRSFQELLPLFALGQSGLDEWSETVQKTGASTERASDALEKTKDEMTTLAQAVRGDGIDVFMEFRGAVEGAYQILIDVAVAFHEAMQESGPLRAAVDFLAVAFKAVETGVAAAIVFVRQLTSIITDMVDDAVIGVEGFGKVVSDIFAGLSAGTSNFFKNLAAAAAEAASAVASAFQAAGRAIYDALHGDISAAKKDFDGLVEKAQQSAAKIASAFSQSISGFSFGKAGADNAEENVALLTRDKRMFDELKSSAADYQKELSTIWGNEESHSEEPVATNKGRMAPADSSGAKKAAQEELDAQLKSIDGQIAAARAAEKEKEELYAHEEKIHEITAGQKLALTRQAVDAEYQVELGLLQKELALDGQRPDKRQETLNKIESLERSHAERVQQIQFQASEQSFQTWDQGLTKITGEFNSQLRPLLSGSESFGQAFKKIVADMVISFIEGAEKMAAQWLAMEASKTSASAAGVATQKAINATSVSGDAGRAAAGAYAATAEIPIVGPALAPAAAAAAYAGTMAFTAFDIGAYDVPSDMPAVVHRGELVMPAQQASAFRSMLEGGAAGGGGDTHVHVHMPSITALDSSDVRSFFKRNARALAEGLNHAVRTGAHVGLSKLGA